MDTVPVRTASVIRPTNAISARQTHQGGNEQEHRPLKPDRGIETDSQRTQSIHGAVFEPHRGTRRARAAVGLPAVHLVESVVAKNGLVVVVAIILGEGALRGARV